MVSRFIILSLCSTASVLAHAPQNSDVFPISWKPSKEPSSVQFTYPGTGLDSPKVKPVNKTTFDWWYFDAVSSDLDSGDLSSVVLTFFDATPGGFEALSNKSTKLEASITGSFKNGTRFGVSAYPTEAVVVTEGDASSGRWGAYGSWKGSKDLKKWVVRFQDVSAGIEGSLMLESVRSSCGRHERFRSRTKCCITDRTCAPSVWSSLQGRYRNAYAEHWLGECCTGRQG